MSIQVQKYIANLGKSVAYTAADVVKSKFDYVNEFSSTNDEVFKEAYSGIKDYKTTFARVKKAVANNKVMDAARAGFDSVVYSVTTGDFYAKNKEQEIINKYGGELTDEFDIDNEDFDWENDDISNGDKAIATAIKKNSKIGTAITAEAIVQSSKAQIETNRDNTILLYTQNERMMSKLDGSINNVLSFLKQSGERQDKITQKQNDNLNKFMTNVDNNVAKLVAQMDELLQMQRNMYNPKKDESKKHAGYNDVVSSKGVLNIKEYGKMVGKQAFNTVNDQFGGSLGMIFGDAMGKDSNMLAQFMATPFRSLMTAGVNKALGASVDKATKELNKTLEGIVPSIMAKLVNMGEDEDSGPFAKMFGQIFGIKGKGKTSIDTSQYNRGAVPFDGTTKRAITDVIPYYLRKMTSALTGMDEMVYNFETGKWQTVKSAIKSFKDASNQDTDTVTKYLKQVLDTAAGGDIFKMTDAKRAEKDQESLQKIAQLFISKGGDLGAVRKQASKDVGYDEELIDALTLAFKDDRDKKSANRASRSKSNITELASVIRDAVTSASNTAKNINEGDNSVARQVFAEGLGGVDPKKYNGTFFNNYGDGDEKSIMKSPMALALTHAKDEYGVTMFEYLRDIGMSLQYIKGMSEYLPLNANATIELYGSVKNKGGGSRGRVVNQLRGAYRQIQGNSSNMSGSDLYKKDNKDKYNFNYYRDKEAAEKRSKEDNYDKEAERYTTEKLKRPGMVGQKKDDEGNEYTYSDMIGYQQVADEDEALLKQKEEEADNTSKMLKALQKSKFINAEQYKKLEKIAYDKEASLKDNMNQAKGFQEKMFVLANWASDNILHKPRTAMVESMYKMDFYLKDLFFGKDYKKGESILSGFKESITKGFKDIGEKLSDFWHKKIWDEKLSKVLEKYVTKPLFGESKDGIREGGLLGDFIGSFQQSLKQNSKDVLEYTKRTAREAKEKVTGNKKDEEEIRSTDTIESHAVGGVNKTGKAIKSALSKGEYLNGKLIKKTGIYTIPKDGTVVNPANAATRAKQARNERKLINKVKSNADANDGLVTTNVKNYEAPDGMVPLGVTDEGYYIYADANNPIITEGEAFAGSTTGANIDTTNAPRVKNKKAAKAGEVASRSLIGGGIGLLAGGPLLGALIGGVSSFSRSTNEFANAIYGSAIEVDPETGEVTRKDDGLLSKEMQKAIPDMKKWGLGGLVAGLITPLGPLVGTLAGAAVGFAKNTGIVQDTIFGEGGVIKPETLDKLKKGSKNMGVGALIGAFTGPFGLVGNAILGATAGYVTSTEKFKKVIFGEEVEIDVYDEKTGEFKKEKKKRGGLVGAIKQGAEPLKNFGKTMIGTVFDAVFGKKTGEGKDAKREGGLFGLVKDQVIKPLAEGIKPLIQQAKVIVDNLGKDIKSLYKRWKNSSAGKAFAGRAGEAATKVGKAAIKGAKGVATVALAPAIGVAHGVKAVGTKVRKGQIKKGNAYDLTAGERLNFRKDHDMEDDDYRGLDEYLEQTNAEDLENFRMQLKNSAANESLDSEDEQARLRQTLGDDLGKYIKPKEQKKIIAMIQKGDLKGAEELIKTKNFKGKLGEGVTEEERKQMLNSFKGFSKSSKEIDTRIEKVKAAGKLGTKELQEKGINIDLNDEKSVSKALENIEREIAHKKAGLTEEEEDQAELRRFWSDKDSPLDPIKNTLQHIADDLDKLAGVAHDDDTTKKDINKMKIGEDGYLEDEENNDEEGNKEKEGQPQQNNLVNKLRNRSNPINKRKKNATDDNTLDDTWLAKRIDEAADVWANKINSVLTPELVAQKYEEKVAYLIANNEMMPGDAQSTALNLDYNATVEFTYVKTKYSFEINFKVVSVNNNEVGFAADWYKPDQPKSYEAEYERFVNDWIERVKPKGKLLKKTSLGSMLKKATKFSAAIALASCIVPAPALLVVGGGVLAKKVVGKIGSVVKEKNLVGRGKGALKRTRKKFLGSHKLDTSGDNKRQNKKDEKYAEEYANLSDEEKQGISEEEYIEQQRNKQLTGRGLVGNIKNLGSRAVSGVKNAVAGKLDAVKQKAKEKKEERRTDERWNKIYDKIDKLTGAVEKGNETGGESKLKKILKWLFVGGICAPIVVGFLKDKFMPIVTDKLSPWLKETVLPKIIGTKNSDGEYEGGLISGIVNPIRNCLNDKFQTIRDWFTNEGEFSSADRGMSGMIQNFKNIGTYVLDLWKSGANTILGDWISKLWENTITYLPEAIGEFVASTARGVAGLVKNLFSDEEEVGQSSTSTTKLLDNVNGTSSNIATSSNSIKFYSTFGQSYTADTTDGSITKDDIDSSTAFASYKASDSAFDFDISVNKSNSDSSDNSAENSSSNSSSSSNTNSSSSSSSYKNPNSVLDFNINSDGTKTYTGKETGMSTTSRQYSENEVYSAGYNQNGDEIFYANDDPGTPLTYDASTGQYVPSTELVMAADSNLNESEGMQDLLDNQQSGDLGNVGASHINTKGAENVASFFKTLYNTHVFKSTNTGKNITNFVKNISNSKTLKNASKVWKFAEKLPVVGRVMKIGRVGTKIATAPARISAKLMDTLDDKLTKRFGKNTAEEVAEDAVTKTSEELFEEAAEAEAKEAAGETVEKSSEELMQEAIEAEAKENAEKEAVESTTKNIGEDLTKNATQNTAENVAKEGVEEVAENTAENVGKETVENLGENLTKNATQDVVENVAKEGVEEVAENTAENVAKNVGKDVVENVAKEGAEELGEEIFSTGGKKLFEGLKKIFTSNKCAAFLKSAGAKWGKECTEKGFTTAFKSMVTDGLKKAPKAAAKGIKNSIKSAFTKTNLIISGAMMIADFIVGWNDAANVLGVLNSSLEKAKCKTAMKVMAGCFKACCDLPFFGIVVSLFEDTIVKFFIDHIAPMIFPETAAEIQELQADAEATVAEYNAENGTNLSIEDYNARFDPTNIDKVKQGASNAFSALVGQDSNTKNAVQSGSIEPANKTIKKIKEKLSAIIGRIWQKLGKDNFIFGDEEATESSSADDVAYDKFLNAFTLIVDKIIAVLNAECADDEGKLKDIKSRCTDYNGPIDFANKGKKAFNNGKKDTEGILGIKDDDATKKIRTIAGTCNLFCKILQDYGDDNTIKNIVVSVLADAYASDDDSSLSDLKDEADANIENVTTAYNSQLGLLTVDESAESDTGDDVSYSDDYTSDGSSEDYTEDYTDESIELDEEEYAENANTRDKLSPLYKKNRIRSNADANDLNSDGDGTILAILKSIRKILKNIYSAVSGGGSSNSKAIRSNADADDGLTSILTKTNMDDHWLDKIEEAKTSKKLKSLTKKISRYYKNKGEEVPDDIRTALKTKSESLSNSLSGKLSSLFSSSNGKAIRSNADADDGLTSIEGSATSIIDKINRVTSRDDLSTLTKKIYRSFKNKGKEVTDDIKTAIEEKKESLPAKLKSTASSALNKAVSTASSASSTLGNAISYVKDTAGNVISTADDLMTKYNPLYSGAKNIASSVVSTAKNVAGTVYDAAGNVISTADDLMTKYNPLYSTAKNVASNVDSYLSENSSLYNKAKSLGSSAVNKIKSIFSNADADDGLTSILTKTNMDDHWLNKIEEAKTSKKLKALTKKIYKYYKSKGEEVPDDIKTALSTKRESISSSTSNITSKLSSLFGKSNSKAIHSNADADDGLESVDVNVSDTIDESLTSLVGDDTENIADAMSKLTNKSKTTNEKIDKLELVPTNKDYWKIEGDNENPVASGLFKFKELMNRVVKAPFAIAAAENAVSSTEIIDDSSSSNSTDSNGNTTTETSESLKKWLNKIKSRVSGSGKGKGRYGHGDPNDPDHIYQREYNRSYNTSGDSEYQSVADSGCGPAAATSLLRMYGKDADMNTAVSYALNNKYKEVDGGTYPEYFSDYLGSNGIATNSNATNADVVSNLASGKPVILMGRNTDNSNAPYGSKYSHYVVARGLDENGNVIVEDSEDKEGNTRYNLADTLKNSSVKITTGAGRSRYGRGTNNVDQSMSDQFLSNVSNAISSAVYATMSAATNAAVSSSSSDSGGTDTSSSSASTNGTSGTITKDTDVKTKCGYTEEQLVNAINDIHDGCEASNYPEAALADEDTYGINALFTLAVAIQEQTWDGLSTRNGPVNTTGANFGNYNVFNIEGTPNDSNGRWKDYDSYTDAFESFGKLISGDTYYGAGLTTPELIGDRYCPASADGNDSTSDGHSAWGTAVAEVASLIESHISGSSSSDDSDDSGSGRGRFGRATKKARHNRKLSGRAIDESTFSSSDSSSSSSSFNYEAYNLGKTIQEYEAAEEEAEEEETTEDTSEETTDDTETETEDSSSSSSSSQSLTSLLSDLTTNMLRGIYGDDVYNALFGSTSSDSDSSSSSSTSTTGTLEQTEDADTNMKTLFSFFTSSGMSDNLAAGILGNIQTESGFMPNILEGENPPGSGTVTVSQGKGYGLIQWTGSPSRAWLYNWCTANGCDPDTLDGQARCVVAQIKNENIEDEENSDNASKFGGSTGAGTMSYNWSCLTNYGFGESMDDWNDLSIEEATELWLKCVERAGVEVLQTRIKNAKEILEACTGGSGRGRGGSKTLTGRAGRLVGRVRRRGKVGLGRGKLTSIYGRDGEETTTTTVTATPSNSTSTQTTTTTTTTSSSGETVSSENPSVSVEDGDIVVNGEVINTSNSSSDDTSETNDSDTTSDINEEELYQQYMEAEANGDAETMAEIEATLAEEGLIEETDEDSSSSSSSSDDNLLSQISNLATTSVRAIFGDDVYNAVFGSTSSDSSSSSSASNGDSSSIVYAAAQVFEALYNADNSLTYDSSGGTHHDLTCRDGTVLEHERPDCSGMMSAVIHYMGYYTSRYNAETAYTDTYHGEGFGTSNWATATTNECIYDKDGNLSSDWVLSDFDPDDRQQGDIIFKSGHTDMFIFMDSTNYPRGFNAGSGDHNASGGDTGDGMYNSYCLGKYYLDNGALPDSNSSDVGSGRGKLGAGTIKDNVALKTLRYVGSGSGYGRGSSRSGKTNFDALNKIPVGTTAYTDNRTIHTDRMNEIAENYKNGNYNTGKGRKATTSFKSYDTVLNEQRAAARKALNERRKNNLANNSGNGYSYGRASSSSASNSYNNYSSSSSYNNSSSGELNLNTIISLLSVIAANTDTLQQIATLVSTISDNVDGTAESSKSNSSSSKTNNGLSGLQQLLNSKNTGEDIANAVYQIAKS